MGDEQPSEHDIPSTLGKYRLIAELGSGGMARVFLAVMRGRSGFNKLAVLKVPRLRVMNDPDQLSMFIDEARIAARLSHPNVVQTFEVIRESGIDIIVMEYLDGYTLNDLITRARKDKRTLPRSLVLRIISEALTGLHYAHSAKDFDGTPLNLVHRDISPHNIFLTFDGQVKLLDFGIAKAATQTHETKFGAFKGKVRYMPREQLTGSDIDRRTDIFAVGTMLWEAAVGDRLWRKKSDVEVMSAIIAGEIPSPRETNPDVPPELEGIIMKALATEKSDRYSSCLDLQKEIDQYLATHGGAPSLREVVSYLEEVFSEPRAKRQAVIDEQLKLASLRSDGDAAPLASIPPPSESLPSQSGSGSAARAYTVAAGTPPPASEASTSKTLTPSPSSRPRIAVIALSFAVLASVLVFLVRARAHPPTDVVATTANPPSAALTSPSPVAEVKLTFSASPPEATLYLDDEPLSSNPHSTKLPKDGRSHALRAEARGYATKSMTFPIDSDKEIVVSLEKVAAPTTTTPVAYAPRAQPVARPHPASPPPVASATATATIPTSPPPPKPDTSLSPPQARKPRSLDTGNPWDK